MVGAHRVINRRDARRHEDRYGCPAAIGPPGGKPMRVYYWIHHNGEPIAAADSIEQAEAILKESRPGTCGILEVRDDAQARSHLKARNWGLMIHPNDGPVVLDPQDWTRQEALP
jgi:hypothetical protein